jgi:hypothetical protein
VRTTSSLCEKAACVGFHFFYEIGAPVAGVVAQRVQHNDGKAGIVAAAATASFRQKHVSLFSQKLEPIVGEIDRQRRLGTLGQDLGS